MHGVLLVDKPSGPTSHDVVAWARRALSTRAVGHTGTLDPMATGVLGLVIGEATKLVPYLTAEDKAYEASLELGVETDTLDAQGEAVRRGMLPHGLDVETVQHAVDTMLGEQWQTPPLVSAIKVGGERLYAKARRGEEVEVAPRRVVLQRGRVSTVNGCQIAVRLDCGKGYYVRAFVRDLASKLGTVGHLTALRRVRQGTFGIERCVAGDVLQALARGAAREHPAVVASLLSMSEACAGMTRRVLDAEGCKAAFHGQRVPLHALGEDTDSPLLPEEHVALFDGEGVLQAIGTPEEGRLRIMRGFRY